MLAGEPDDEPESSQEPPAAGRLEIEIDVQVPLQEKQRGQKGRLDAAAVNWLIDHLTRAAGLLGVAEGQLSLAIVDDAVMADLHQRYTQVPGTTDVLTFDLRDDPADPIEADVVLCYDEAARQADKRGHDVSAELLLYAVHGLLHLLGYDDQDPQQARKMHEKEDELLTAVGLGPIYASSRKR